MTLPLTGSCQREAVNYTVSANPLFTYTCHCKDCQKRTGSAFSMGLVVLTASLQVEGALTAWARNKQAWVKLPARARPFETEPETAAEWLQTAIDYRAGL